MTVYLVVYDKAAFVLSEKLFSSITQYIDDKFIEDHPSNRRGRPGCCRKTTNKIINVQKRTLPEEMSNHVMFVITTDRMENVNREFIYEKAR